MPGSDDERSREPVDDRSSDVVAVVTAFHPDGRLVEVCVAALAQTAAVVVVDDGSGPEAESLLARCADAGAVVLRRPTNSGIAAATNAGVRRALELVPSAAALLTLDQDSVLPDGYVQAVLDAWRSATAQGVCVGMVGPVQASGVRRAAAGATDAPFLPSREPIQSGLLVPRVAFEALGPFDEGLFIDGVDTDYYLRGGSAGLRAVAAPGARLGHQLGRTADVRLAGRTFAVVHAATFRYYFIARNRVALVRRHGRRHPAWAVSAVLRDVRHLLTVSVLVPGRRERLRETAVGLRDGLRGVEGPRRG